MLRYGPSCGILYITTIEENIMTKATKVIAQRIKELRIDNGLSQAALAESAGIDRKTINRIEKNHFSPNLDTFFRICVALNVQPNEFIKGIKV